MSTQLDNNVTQAPASTAPHVFIAINAVQTDLAYMGITKNQAAKNNKGKALYNFRGIDDIYNALAPLLSVHKLIVSPRFENRETTERVGGQGYSLFFTTLTGHFDFISAIDGSKHTVTTFGEAMDSGDKGTNKAMSIAQKYAFFQLFVIPTQSTPDPDDTVHPQDNYSQPVNPMRDVYADQKNNYAPSLPAPVSEIAYQKDDKNYNKQHLRIFNADEFKTLLQAVYSGEYPASRFIDAKKYYYSDQQLSTLQGLSQQ